MSVALATFLFTVWKFREESRTVLAFVCEILEHRSVRLVDASVPFAFGPEGQMIGATDSAGFSRQPMDIPSGYVVFPRTLVVPVGRSITNHSKRRVYISRVHASFSIGLVVLIGLPGILGPIVDADGEPARLPRPLDPAEETIFIVEVGWPIEASVVQAIEHAFPSLEQVPYWRVQHEVEDTTPRTVELEVVATDGQTATATVLRVGPRTSATE